MSSIDIKKLLDAGVHFGHLTRKWHPAMAPYIFMERNGIHIIDLHKTAIKMEEAAKALKKIASTGRKIMFVATKKQAKDIVAEYIKEINMPYITERWPGGMFTNFVTIRKAVKKMSSIDRMKADGTFNILSKRERLQIDRKRANLEKNLGSISDMTRLPGALFVVDIKREHIAVAEARKLNIPIFGIVDTNSNPELVDYVIPANDDASKSISMILDYVTASISEGLADRKVERERAKQEQEAKKAAEADKKASKSTKPSDKTEEPKKAVDTPKKKAVSTTKKEGEKKEKVVAKKAEVKKTEIKKKEGEAKADTEKK